jgi:antitoxin (DNA-binding transcriptional repressor) of toxin-antitoxin stability system
METATMDVHDAETHFKEMMLLVNSGTAVMLRDGDRPVARIVPAQPRIAGLHAGTIKTCPDFDEPLPEAFWSSGT